jgi:hypothetical protein
MNAKLVSEAESLRDTANRLKRAGLIIDPNALSPAHRRAAFALQCLVACCPEQDNKPERESIGFAYPNSR